VSIRFSVVVPAYNRVHQLKLLLAAFEMQKYPLDKYEVIIVDDGSTDGTKQLLTHYRAPYRLKYIRTAQRGRSAARNRGVREANGRYIIFCDTDFLVTPDFIRTHHEYHHRNSRSIVCGAPNIWKDVYTHYYPSYAGNVARAVQKAIRRSGRWKASFVKDKRVLPTISPRAMKANFAIVRSLRSSTDVSDYMKRVLMTTDVAPWFLFVTRNVSLKRKFLLNVRGFNEKLTGWGFEDWELGYRLHRQGIRFVPIRKRIGYHMHHPEKLRGKNHATENLRKALRIRKYKDFQLNLLTSFPGWGDIPKYKSMLRTLKRWERMNQKHKNMARAYRRRQQIIARRFAQAR